MARQTLAISMGVTDIRFPNGTLIAADPFIGSTTQWTNDGGALRAIRLPSEVDISPQFADAMAELGIYEQETIHLDIVSSGSAADWRAGRIRDEITIQPASRFAQPGVNVVLYQDEAGGLSWHFPDDFQPGEREPEKVRSGLRAFSPKFTISARTIAARRVASGARQPTHLRGPITKVGRKIFKILFIPLLEPVLARPIELIISKVEKKCRQELVRAVTLENYREKVPTAFSDWSRLDGRRSLLIVHGIFNSTEGMLAQLPPAAMSELLSHYDGRVIGFDQITGRSSTNVR